MAYRIVNFDKTEYYSPEASEYLHLGSYAGLIDDDGNFENNLTNITDINHNISNEWCKVEVVKKDNTAADIYVTLSKNDWGEKREVIFKLQYGTTKTAVSYTIVLLSYINGIGFAFNHNYSSYTLQDTFYVTLKLGILQHSKINSTRVNLEILSGWYEAIPSTLTWNTQNNIGYRNFADEYQLSSVQYEVGHMMALYDEYNFTHTGTISIQTLLDWIDNFVTEKNGITSYKHIISADTEATNSSWIQDTAISASYYTRIGTVLCKFYKIGSTTMHYIGYLPFICYVKKETGNNYKMLVICNQKIRCYYQKGNVIWDMCNILDTCTESEYNDGTDIYVGSDVI